MIHWFEKTYGRYFDDTAEYWRKQDKVIEKEIEFAMEKANEEKEEKEKTLKLSKEDHLKYMKHMLVKI
jgi:hypothetical protein